MRQENIVATWHGLESLAVMDFDAGTVFSSTPSGTLVKGYATTSLHTPETDPNYIFHE